jgi:hypothetical protein
MQLLIKKLDGTAPGVFVALLTAAKRHNPQGRFSWTTEEDAWNQIGLPVDNFNFTFETFIRCLGDLKQTRKTSRGRIKEVQIRSWGDWQQIARTGSGRKDHPNRSDSHYIENPAWAEQQERLANRANTAPEERHESDGESDGESEAASGEIRLPKNLRELFGSLGKGIPE